MEAVDDGSRTNVVEPARTFHALSLMYGDRSAGVSADRQDGRSGGLANGRDRGGGLPEGRTGVRAGVRRTSTPYHFTPEAPE